MKYSEARLLPAQAWRAYEGFVAPNLVAACWLVAMVFLGDDLVLKVIGVAAFVAAQLTRPVPQEDVNEVTSRRVDRWMAAIMRGVEWYEFIALPVVLVLLVRDSRGLTLTGVTSAALLVLTPRIVMLALAALLTVPALALVIPLALILAVRLWWRTEPQPPGLVALKVAELLLGRRVAQRVFGQIVYDGVEEWAEANGGSRRWLARWIKLRTYVHMLIQLLSVLPTKLLGFSGLPKDD